jgi:hypothetical protein
MGLSLASIDIGSTLSGIGDLAKKIRSAITGKEPIDANKAAELALDMQRLDSDIEKATLAVVLAEAQSADPWTSRARPTFPYVMYIMLLTAIPMGIVCAVNPAAANNIIVGFKAWLSAIPTELYTLFGVGYLGYGGFRSYDKAKGVASK